MTLNPRERIILELSETLPPLADSVNDLISFVKSDGLKRDKEFLLKIANITVNLNKVLKVNDLRELTENNEESQLLYKTFIDSLKLVSDGCAKFLTLLVDECDFDEQQLNPKVKKLLDENKNCTVDSAIEDLYEGSKLILKVIDMVIL